MRLRDDMICGMSLQQLVRGHQSLHQRRVKIWGKLGRLLGCVLADLGSCFNWRSMV